MNFQTTGRSLQIYFGKFRDNGGCGYLLKPVFLRDKNSHFNPLVRKGTRVEGSRVEHVTLRIISGQHLPRPKVSESGCFLIELKM